MKRFLAIAMSFIFVVLCSCTRNDDLSDIPAMSSSATKSEQQIDVLENTSGIQPEISTVAIKTDPDDLYSYFIKNRYEKIYEAQKREGAEVFAEFDEYAVDVFYFIYDIDRNGVDELIMGDWKNTPDEYEVIGAPREIMVSGIYTIENGEVTELSSFWWADDYLWDRVILTNGLIRQSTGVEDYPTYSYFSLKNGKLVHEYGLGYSPDTLNSSESQYVRFTDLDGKFVEEEITKEEFERLRDEANGDSEIVEINWKRIDEYGK